MPAARRQSHGASTRWTKQVLHIRTFVRHSDMRALLVVYNLVEDGKYAAAALETELPSIPDTATRIAYVFGNHAHKVLGVFDEPRSAKAACTAYAESWALRGPCNEAPCDCAEIVEGESGDQ